MTRFAWLSGLQARFAALGPRAAVTAPGGVIPPQALPRTGQGSGLGGGIGTSLGTGLTTGLSGGVSTGLGTDLSPGLSSGDGPSAAYSSAPSLAPQTADLRAGKPAAISAAPTRPEDSAAAKLHIAVIAEVDFNLVDGSTIWLLNLCRLLCLERSQRVTLVLPQVLHNPVLAQLLPPEVRLVDPRALGEEMRESARAEEAQTPLASRETPAALAALEAKIGRIDRVILRGTQLLEAFLAAPHWRGRLWAYVPSVLPDISQAEPIWLAQARAQRLPLLVQSRASAELLECFYDYPAARIHLLPPVWFAAETDECAGVDHLDPLACKERSAPKHDMAADRPQDAAQDRGSEAVPAPRLQKPSPQSAPEMPPQSPPRLCYAGKIDLSYGLDWLMALCADPAVRVEILAGKDSWRQHNPAFFTAFDLLRQEALSGARPQLSYACGLGHAQAQARMARADLAWCLRHELYDDVLEVSTKVIEFCALGVPPLVNDTALNRGLFGADYPYLVDIRRADLLPWLAGLLRQIDPETHAAARARLRQVAAPFAATSVAPHLAQALRGRPAEAKRQRGHDLLIATHERKFLPLLCDRLEAEPGLKVFWQDWPSSAKPPADLPPDPAQLHFGQTTPAAGGETETGPEAETGPRGELGTSAQTGPGAAPLPPAETGRRQTVLCEWACENAVWHSQSRVPGRRLILRLHRFEAFRDFPQRIRWENVDLLIVVSEHFRRKMIAEFGLRPEQVVVQPQPIDWQALQRPKRPEARFTLGLVGINPFDHKRFDRALEFLAALRARDPRFHLAVRSVMPWQIPWVWEGRADERRRFTELFQHLFSDPHLASAVRFDPAGPDMEEWFRGVGVILSSSDSEGCHTAVMEGMASGALPILHAWEGAAEFFGAEHVFADMRDAIPKVIAFAEADDPSARAALAEKMRPYSAEPLAQLLLGEAP